MTQKDLNNWIMYHEIQNLQRLGFSAARISRYLVLDARTARKYLNMDEQEYEQFLVRSSKRNKILDCYEQFVADCLFEYHDTPAAQLHDWLKEHHPDFPEVSPRTVYNFVMFVRQKYNIPIVQKFREYFPVEELPYGQQSQIDFGQYNMQLSNGKRKNVRFFVMVLSRSRMKYIWFLDKPFTSETVVIAHEKAFEFFGGIPITNVYDQDRTMFVDENIGELILTSTFSQYTKSRNFKLHLCRKADPESKGKVENVVQYVKKNFLYNRVYHDIGALNDQAIAWLGRTANYLEHNYTKKSPIDEFNIEKQYLNPYTPLTTEHKELKMYMVRKTNIISYKSNFYSLPSGSYKGTGTQVFVKESQDNIAIYDKKNELLCTHQISLLKGKTIINTNHRRDTSSSLENMIERTLSYFSNGESALGYIKEIRKKYPRYTRDHLEVMLKSLATGDKDTADKALVFCLKNDIINAQEWCDVFEVFFQEGAKPIVQNDITLLDKTNLEKANEMPQESDIETYEKIINQ